MNTKYGGSAFPSFAPEINGAFFPGMTLRDYAMVQFIAAQISKSGMDGFDIADTINGAGMFFDAMLAAREAKQ